MITPPSIAPCFYTVLFESEGAEGLMKLMAPESSKKINQVLITSTDIPSDVEAMNELQAGAISVMESTKVKFDQQLKFNPLYLPISRDELEKAVEVNKEGDIQTIAGFSNPFVAVQMQFSTDKTPDAADGKVCFKPFELPSYSEMINNSVVPS